MNNHTLCKKYEDTKCLHSVTVFEGDTKLPLCLSSYYCEPISVRLPDNKLMLIHVNGFYGDNDELSDVFGDSLFVSGLYYATDVEGKDYTGRIYHWGDFNPEYDPDYAVSVNAEVVWDDNCKSAQLPSELHGFHCRCTWDEEEEEWDTAEISEEIAHAYGCAVKVTSVQVLTPSPSAVADVYKKVPEWAVGHLALCHEEPSREKWVLWDEVDDIRQDYANVCLDAGAIVLGPVAISKIKKTARQVAENQYSGTQVTEEDICKAMSRNIIKTLCKYMSYGDPDDSVWTVRTVVLNSARTIERISTKLCLEDDVESYVNYVVTVSSSIPGASQDGAPVRFVSEPVEPQATD